MVEVVSWCDVVIRSLAQCFSLSLSFLICRVGLLISLFRFLCGRSMTKVSTESVRWFLFMFWTIIPGLSSVASSCAVGVTEEGL